MFAENLRDARKRKDITQKQAAEIFGVSQSTYALYEVGKREPSFETLMRMADYFGVSCDSLLGYNEKTPGRENVLRRDPAFDSRHGNRAVLVWLYMERLPRRTSGNKFR